MRPECERHQHREGEPPKVSYGTGAKARAALHTIRTLGEAREKKPVREYKCEGCGRWFLTSHPE